MVAENPETYVWVVEVWAWLGRRQLAESFPSAAKGRLAGELVKILPRSAKILFGLEGGEGSNPSIKAP